MALQPSGSISLSDIQAEFGGSNPISVSEYYRGAGLVTSNNDDVPEAGQISISNFYGAAGLATIYEQVLTGSGTFTPLYAGVPALITMQSGSGGGNRAGNWSVYQGMPKGGQYGQALRFFVEDIDTLSGVSYSVAGSAVKSYGGYNGAFLVGASPQADGQTTSFGQTTMTGGGGGRYKSSSSVGLSGIPSETFNPYPANELLVPSEALLSGVIVDPLVAITISSIAGQAGIIYNTPTGGFTQTIFPASSNASAGSLSIYYFI